MSKWTRPWMSILLVLALVVAFGLLAVGCGEDETEGEAETTTEEGTDTTEGEEPAEGELAEDQTLTVEIASEPPSLDPNLATDTTSSLIINNIFEGLVRLDENGDAQPGAAESWEVSEDGLTYTFHLREDDAWTNGDPVTSEDFKNSWLRILAPETAADYAYQLYFIEGAEEYNAGEGAAEDVAIETPDPETLVVTLKSVTPWFLPLLSHQAYFPIPLATVEEFGDQWTEPENIVTNGRFTLASWEHEASVTLQKWPEHWDADSVFLETVNLPMIEESTTAVAAWENGELDIVRDLPVADMDRLKAMPEYTSYPLLGIYYYGFNVEHSPLDDVNVRKALALAIDRQTIVENVTKQGQIPATSFTPEGMPGFETYVKNFLQPTADVEQAKALLEEAGYADGFDITIFYNTSESHQAIATAIQSMWQEIGVNASLQNMEWKQYLDFVQNDPETQVYRMGWVADFNDAYNFLDILRGGGGNNYTRWASDEYDELLDAALQAETDEERFEIYSQMEEIISVEEMPVAPIYWYTNPDLVRDYVQGWQPNALGELTNFEGVQILAH
ncbi:MAG: oligopeptide ABC transporter substrate-binding protein OppA [Thermoleophilia bacterium]